MPGVGRLDMFWPLPVGAYASVVKWRKHGDTRWNQLTPPFATACSLTGLEPTRYDLQVVLLPTGGVLSEPATPLPAPAAPPIVAINNSTGFGQQCDDLFASIGVNTERLDIGQGNFALADVAIQRGKSVLPLFSAGDHNGNLTVAGAPIPPATIASSIAALAPELASRARLITDNGIPVLEFGNEVYQTLSATAYGAMYHAAKQAAAGHVKLLAVASTPAWSTKHAGSGNWFTDFKAGLTAAGGSPADIDGWTVHPYPADVHTTNANLTDVVQSGDYAGQGWPMIQTLYDQALAAGFPDVGWWITETGITRDPGPDVQAKLISAMLTDAHQRPYLRMIAIYAACDDTERFGILTGTAPNLQTTPAFTAMRQAA